MRNWSDGGDACHDPCHGPCHDPCRGPCLPQFQTETSRGGYRSLSHRAGRMTRVYGSKRWTFAIGVISLLAFCLLDADIFVVLDHGFAGNHCGSISSQESKVGKCTGKSIQGKIAHADGSPPATKSNKVGILMVSNIDPIVSEDLSDHDLRHKPDIPYATVAAVANFAWAQRHGYEFRYVVLPKDGMWHAATNHTRPPTYWKSYEAVRAFHEMDLDWILYLDTDAVVSHHDQTFQDVIADARGDPTPIAEKDWNGRNHNENLLHQVHDPFMVTVKDVRRWPGVCAGVFAVRNSLESQKAMCDWWWDERETSSEDQHILNMYLWEGLNSTAPSFWRDHVSILPARFLYRGERIRHATAGESGWAPEGECKEKLTDKLPCLRYAYSQLNITADQPMMSDLKASVVRRSEDDVDVCRARMWRYPRTIRPQDVCEGIRCDKKDAVAFFVTETKDKNAFEKALQELKNAAQRARFLYPHQDIVIGHAPLQSWTDPSVSLFSNFTLLLPDYVKVVSLPRAVDIDKHLPIEYKSIAEASDNCCGWLELQKLAIWTLEQYSSILLLDTETVSFSRVNNLFDCKSEKFDFLSTPGPLEALNGGFLWLRPSVAEYESMLSYLKIGIYTHQEGWFQAGQLHPEYLVDKETVRAKFGPGSLVKNTFGQETVPGFLFWYFYIRQHNLSVAQVDTGAQRGGTAVDETRH